jgi:hypothetical protein
MRLTVQALELALAWGDRVDSRFATAGLDTSPAVARRVGVQVIVLLLRRAAHSQRLSAVRKKG